MKKIVLMSIVIILNLNAGYLNFLEAGSIWGGRKNLSPELKYIGIKYINTFELSGASKSLNKKYDVTGTEISLSINTYETDRIMYVNNVFLGYNNVSYGGSDLTISDDYFLNFGGTTGIKYMTFFAPGLNVNIGLNIGFEMQGSAEMDDIDTVDGEATYIVEPTVGLEFSPFDFILGYKKTGNYETMTFKLNYKLSGY